MKRLTSEDIIDLELFIRADAKESEDYKSSRDFKIYSSASDEDKRDKMSLLKHWIREMRTIKGASALGGVIENTFKFFSGILFLAGLLFVGIPLANAFFVETDSSGVINVSYFFFSCIFAQFVLLLSAIFFAPMLAFWVDTLISKILDKFFSAKGSLNALYSTNKNWILMKGAFAAQCLGFGVACGIFLTQLFRPAFNEYHYGWRTTMPNYITSARVESFVSAVSLPFAIFGGEGATYPSLEQVDSSRITDVSLAEKSQNLKTESEQGSDSSQSQNVEKNPKYEAWAVFFILSSFFYGVIVRGAFLIYIKVKLSRVFGEHRIRNDRKVAEILHRLTFASFNSTIPLRSMANEDSSSLAILIRSDLATFKENISNDVCKSLCLENADFVFYSFCRELFDDKVAESFASKKNIAFVCLADDYNEEIFENIQAFINRYPDKFISVHLLGRLSKQDGTFRPPLPVEKSWWERKMNSISTRNLKLY